ncbi:MAG: YdeI/OmpD-associated family protein [Chitinophagales bacterium]|nr:YdeI/OmpD-associated family protein [Chitinophagales bacterium]
MLYQASETTKGLRQLRYQTFDEIDEKTVRNFIQQSIQFKDEKLPEDTKNKKIIIPEILEKALGSDKHLSDAFSGFTPFKQKEFIEYLETAKQEKTKQNRLEKILPMIKNGVGLNDKYR